MAKKIEENKDVNEEKIFNTWDDSYAAVSKMGKDSFLKVYKPWIECTREMLDKTSLLSKEATQQKYKEFFDLWMDTYQEIYGKPIQSMEPSKEMFEQFAQSANIYLSIYKSWISALETMLEKAKEMSKQTYDPEGYKEFCNLWVRTYEKAFDGFFDDMPTMGGPMKEIMEPVKVMAKMYADTFSRRSKVSVKSDFGSASAYPGKNKKLMIQTG